MKILKQAQKVFQKLGPGFITGASDNDPSGLTTYAQAGAQFGKKIVWTSLWLLPLMISVQEMAARIGMVTGQGITQVLLRRFSRWFVQLIVILVVVANTINIGANVAGMAEVVELVSGMPHWLAGIVLTTAMIMLQVFMPYKRYMNVLKWCALSLVSYLVAVCTISVNWGDMLYHALVPSVDFRSRDFWYIFIAILGTTISPYLIFWQTSQEVEEEIDIGRKTVKQREGATPHEITSMRKETGFGMFFSNIVMLSVMAVTASVLFGKNGEIGFMADAAMALEPLAGKFSAWLFSFGVIGTGLLAIPVLAAASAYGMAEVFDRPQGLYLKWHQARFFYGVIVVATFIGLCIKLIGMNAVQFLILSAVINGLVSPLLIVAMLLVANDKAILPGHTNSWWANIFGFSTVLFFVVAIVGFILAYVF